MGTTHFQTHMNRYKKLLNNSLVFAVGNFGSKFISLFMVPLYTFVLTTSEYGTIDLLTNSINLIIPFLTLSLDQSLLRFIMYKKKDQNDNRYLSSTIFVYLSLFLIGTLLLYPLFFIFSIFENYRIYFFIILFLNGLQTLLLQFCRGIGEIKVYALNGIMQTFVFASLNIFFLVVLRLQVTGYFLAMLLGILFSIVYLTYMNNIIPRLKLKYIEKKIIKEMLIYSIPLIPNSTMWWLVNNSTRYIILFFLGPAANGLFAVATKVPTIINTFTGIFTQAWQLSAFEEYDSEDRDKFYSDIFEYYYQILFIISSGIMVTVLFLTTNLISKNFFDSWKIIPALMLGTVFQTLAGFLGSIYTASMKTKGVFSSSLLGALLSIACNFVFIPLLGISGAGYGTALGFFGMMMFRLFKTREYVYTKIDYRLFSLNIVLFVFQWGILYYTYDNLYMNIALETILFLLVIIINRKILSITIRKFLLKK